jgi:hypothetical protein
VLFLSVMRREAARMLVSEIARAIAGEQVRVRRVSRRQHLRNGFAALLDASSQVALRPRLVPALVYATRESLRAQLRYGITELRRATALPPHRQHRLFLVAAPSIAVGLAFAVRSRRESGPIEPATGPANEP